MKLNGGLGVGVAALVSLLLGAQQPLVSAGDLPTADVVLVGATGNLAGKYLWRAMFNLHLVNMHETNINFYGAGRDTLEKGMPKVQDFLASRVSCDDNAALCTPEALAHFKAGVSYVQLKTRDHYAALCKDLDAREAASGVSMRGRLFYLSIPPFAYAEIAETLNAVCTPKNGGFLRVAFEKPFGHDLESAEEMAASLAAHLAEDQIYRFDHYLGKVGVSQITQFRLANPQVEAVLNRDHVTHIMVSMTETEDCQGRSGFYDKYGVIRDIHQNHLMEVLTLAMMEVDAGATPFANLQAKANFLKSMRTVKDTDVLLGQYEGYKEHVQEDLKDPSVVSKTPTFAYAELKVDSPRWEGIPVTMVAGKGLNQRQAEIAIHFKDRASLVFHVQGGTPKVGPTTYLNKRGPLADIKVQRPNPAEWVPSPAGDPRVESAEFDVALAVGIPGNPDLPYNRLLAAMFAGHQNEFVGTAGLLESWRIWSGVLKAMADAEPYVHPVGESYKEMIIPLAKHHKWFGHDGKDL